MNVIGTEHSLGGQLTRTTAAGRRDLVTIKQGATTLQTLDYLYDPATKRLKNIVAGTNTFSFGYDGWGRRKTLSYPNGVTATYSYRSDTDWLIGINYPEINLSISYNQHDKVGNRKQRSEDGTTTDYSYDKTYQLTQAKTGPAEENYTYDKVGNRESGPTVKDTPAASYDHDLANRMLKGRKFGYQYDKRGNRTRIFLSADQTKRWEYSWDGENRLTQAKLINGTSTLRTVSFKYDPFGRRIEKQTIDTATLTTTYSYDGEDIVLQSVDNGTTTTSTRFIHGPGIDEPLAMLNATGTFYYHADGLGSIVAISDSSKNIVARYRYDSFGNMSSTAPEFENAYAFTGREWDRELGLYYYRARYYDAMEGRFISVDPIGFASGDVNLFRYVGNGPVKFKDPSGLAVFGFMGTAGAGFLGYFEGATGYVVDTDGREGTLVVGSGRESGGLQAGAGVGWGLLIAPAADSIYDLAGEAWDWHFRHPRFEITLTVPIDSSGNFIWKNFSVLFEKSLIGAAYGTGASKSTAKVYGAGCPGSVEDGDDLWISP